MGHQFPSGTLNVFDDAVDATGEDDTTCSQKCSQGFLPWHVLRSNCRCFAKASPEGDEVDEEETEEDYLYPETDFDYYLTQIGTACVLLCQDAST